MFCMLKKKKKYSSYFSKQIKLPKAIYCFNNYKQRKMALYCSKTLSVLLRGITSKTNGDFYCLNCCYSFRTKKKRGSHRKVRESRNFGNILMSFEDTKILEFDQYQQLDKATFIIYVDLEWLIKKTDGY